ncbi:uncharacterized protein LOC125037538 isoform X2 [Penaeus chinensis]|uniref:uncharacterized protein LOC125037538 isoform X2 n=1 Tax=Penaeus chinensis TaxID=139456 RepID=UPI001FB72558|nr:uncharacterized protein LOC125037538 isoform X2 [Penaeus chinensis]XP_047486662.1 uncharacterized protein LOC125037538 isoform X2 [Penaeus chinensis]
MFVKGFRLLHKPTRRVICSPSIAKLSSQPNPENAELMEEREFKWLWPAYREVEMLKAGHDIGCKHTGGRYRYNTVKPLNPGHVEQALRHYQRKIDNCRCFLKEHDGKWWVCEDANPEIDFEYLEGAESSAVIKQLTSEPFFADSTPTWKARTRPRARRCPLPYARNKGSFPLPV